MKTYQTDGGWNLLIETEDGKVVRDGVESASLAFQYMRVSGQGLQQLPVWHAIYQMSKPGDNTGERFFVAAPVWGPKEYHPASAT